jgi:uridine phosphorylase
VSEEIAASDHGEPALLTAARLLEWRSRLEGYAPPELPDAAILTHQRSLLPKRPRFSRYGRGISGEVRSYSGISLVGCTGVGGPATAVVIEELAVAGVRRLITIDIAGSLDRDVPSGRIVLVKGAIAADGTSRHYTSEPVVAPDAALMGVLSEALTQAEMEFSTGIVWSTDAVYRETPSLVAAYRSQGAVLVDMDTAAALAVAMALGMEAAAVLVAADELYDGWRSPKDMGVIQSQLHSLLPLAAACLRK